MAYSSPRYRRTDLTDFFMITYGLNELLVFRFVSLSFYLFLYDRATD